MASKRMKLQTHGSLAPKFWKIIINPKDHMLRIPSEFMRRHGRNLPDQVSIKAPFGSVRQVQLLRSDGETWLDKGWQEFKDYYSIGFLQLLVFTYDRNSHFDVLICGADGVQIEYPRDNDNVLNRTGDQVQETMDIESESDESVVLLNKIPTNQKRKGGGTRVELADHKGNTHFSEFLGSSRKKVSFPNRQDEPDTASREKPVAVYTQECSNYPGKQSEKRVIRGRSIAYKKAKSSRFRDPFHISLMQPSYVGKYKSSRISPRTQFDFKKKYILSISLTFTRANLPGKQNVIQLRDLNGNTWFVKCSEANHNAKLTTGWKEFVEDNALKVGDACVFEVNERDRLVWDVTIFRS